MKSGLIKNTLTLLLFSVLLVTVACDPEEDDKINLGTAPTNVTFDVVPASEINTYVISSTTPGAFLHQWDFGNGVTGIGESVEVQYRFKGDYTITYTAVTSGGHGSSTMTVSVAEDAPVKCDNVPFWEMLSNCDSRTWILDTDPGALWVGPDPGTTWWQSDDNFGTERPCAANDEWTFNIGNEMLYDTKGDLWAEDYMGFAFECVADGDLAPEVAAWASGTHTYFVEEEDGVSYLTVTGLGAFIGLPKAANGMETTTPVSSVRYRIDKFEEQSTRYFIELSVNFGPGDWRFRIISPK